MSATYVARAPGKLFLLGEYAVLDGGPAVVAAVDRHVEVRLRRRQSALTRVAAPGYCDAVELRNDRGSGDAPAELRFALAAIEQTTLALPALAGSGFEIEIRSELDAGADAGQKLGLGGSAAVSAALVAALWAAAGGDPAARRDEVFATAFASHRLAQGGVGSGADIAASVYGGVLLFEPRPEALPRVRPLPLPPGLHLVVAWSGRAAATAPLVRGYQALEPPFDAGGGERCLRREFVHASRCSVEAFVRAIDAGWLSPRSLNDNGEALERLARDGDLGLLTPELARLVSLARAAGAGAKLSGAGGGDCAIALSGDREIAERVRASWRTASFALVDLDLEPGGVSVAKS